MVFMGSSAKTGLLLGRSPRAVHVFHGKFPFPTHVQNCWESLRLLLRGPPKEIPYPGVPVEARREALRRNYRDVQAPPLRETNRFKAAVNGAELPTHLGRRGGAIVAPLGECPFDVCQVVRFLPCGLSAGGIHLSNKGVEISRLRLERLRGSEVLLFRLWAFRPGHPSFQEVPA